MIKGHIFVCCGTHCVEDNAIEVKNTFINELKKRNLNLDFTLTQMNCIGLCRQGPGVVVIFNDEKVSYAHVKVEDVSRIIEEHLINGQVVKDLLAKPTRK